MDIHRPKAAHSIREFLIEIGTIICGILIAVGLEQIVEAVHRDAEVREARQAIDKELARNFGSSEFYLSQRACAMDRLDELTFWLNSFKTGHPVQISRDLRIPLAPVFGHSVWSVASGSVIAKMPFELRLDYAASYDGLEVQEGIKKNISEHFGRVYKRLSARKMEAEQTEDLLADVRIIRTQLDTYVFNDQVFGRKLLAKLGIKPDQSDYPTKTVSALTRSVCKPLLAQSDRKKPFDREASLFDASKD